MENNPEAEAAEDLEEIDLAPTEEIINNLPDNSRGYLIPTLDKVQNIYRYLPEPAMEILMEFFGVSRAEVYGVISFYPQLRITEPGKYIIVSAGIGIQAFVAWLQYRGVGHKKCGSMVCLGSWVFCRYVKRSLCFRVLSRCVRRKIGCVVCDGSLESMPP